MRRLWGAAALLLALLALSLGNARYARSLTASMAGRLAQAQTMAAQGDWARAGDLAGESFHTWQSHQLYLHVVMRHGDTDQILLSFRALQQYLDLEDAGQYAAASAQLITQLELLAQLERPSLDNIL